MAGGGNFLRHPPLVLYLLKGAKRLVKVLFREIYVKEFIGKGLIVREIPHQGLIEGLSIGLFPLRKVKAGKGAPVPEVGAVQPHGLFKGGLCAGHVVLHQLRLGQVIPYCVAIRRCHAEGLQNALRLCILTVGI